MEIDFSRIFFGQARKWSIVLWGSLLWAATSLQAQAPEQPSSQDPGDGIPFQVVPEREAMLSSQMMSRVESILVKLGDTVTSGQTLVNFDCKELEAKRAGTIAELAAAQDTHHSKLRLQGLGAAGELEVALAASAVDRALANVGQIDATLINCKLVAPFSGDISKLRIKEKEVVAPNQAVLDIVDTQNLKLLMFLPASMSRQVDIGTMIAVRINGDSRLRTASVTRINPRIDGASQSLELEANLVEPLPDLKPGTLGHGKILAARLDQSRNIKPPGQPPLFSSAKAITVLEKSVVLNYKAVASSRPQGKRITYGLSGPDSALFIIDSYQGDIRFINPPDYKTPLNAKRNNIYEVTISASDGTHTTLHPLRITVSNVNDAPVAAPGAMPTYTEREITVVVDSTITLSDVPGTHLTGATATITNPVAGDTLSFTSPIGSGISGTYDNGTGVLTLTGTATLANYQAALRSITFNSSSKDPTVGQTRTSRAITWAVTDANATKVGAQTSAGVTSKINTVAAVEHAPLNLSGEPTGSKAQPAEDSSGAQTRK